MRGRPEELQVSRRGAACVGEVYASRLCSRSVELTPAGLQHTNVPNLWGPMALLVLVSI